MQIKPKMLTEKLMPPLRPFFLPPTGTSFRQRGYVRSFKKPQDLIKR